MLALLTIYRENNIYKMPYCIVDHTTVLITDFANAGRFSCDVRPDGKILIKGVSTTGEKTVCRNFQIFKMQTQNLCPPGRFSISFQLPGPVDDQQISGGFGINGIFEGIVKKR